MDAILQRAKTLLLSTRDSKSLGLHPGIWVLTQFPGDSYACASLRSNGALWSSWVVLYIFWLQTSEAELKTALLTSSRVMLTGFDFLTCKTERIKIYILGRLWVLNEIMNTYILLPPLSRYICLSKLLNVLVPISRDNNNNTYFTRFLESINEMINVN